MGRAVSNAMQDEDVRRSSEGVRRGLPSFFFAGSGSLLALSLAAGVARADCSLPPHAIVWSYPAQGDTGVPTNVDLWVLPSGWNGAPRVTRDGVALPSLSMGYGYDAGELEPNTTYTFQIEPDADGEPAPSFALTFTTGAGPVAPDPGAAPGDITASSSSDRALSALCQAALATQDCFDTGQDTYYQFAPAGSAEGWILVSDSTYRPVVVWPGECGAPTLFRSRYSAPCATLYGIDAAGELHQGEHVCSEAATPVPDTGDRVIDEPPPAGPVRAPDSEPTANDNAPSSRGAVTTPLPSDADGGCSLSPARPASPFQAIAGLTLILAMAAGRFRRRLSASREAGADSVTTEARKTLG